jgi:hypothetical protein
MTYTKEEKRYKKWIESRPCCVCESPPPSDACHVSTKGSGGKIFENLLPMDRKHHQEQHARPWVDWIEKYHIGPWTKALDYQREYDELEKSREKRRKVIRREEKK